MTIEGVVDRGVGGGAESRGLTKKTRSGNEKKKSQKVSRPDETAEDLIKDGEQTEKKGKRDQPTRPIITDNAPLYALLRLRFNDLPEMSKGFKELDGCALIRELHVYGTVVAARPTDETSVAPVVPEEVGGTSLPQHFGFGKRLMAEAERLAAERGFKKIAVISGIGVRNYYRKRGYRLEGMFMVKDLEVSKSAVIDAVKSHHTVNPRTAPTTCCSSKGATSCCAPQTQTSSSCCRSPEASLKPKPLENKKAPCGDRTSAGSCSGCPSSCSSKKTKPVTYSTGGFGPIAAGVALATAAVAALVFWRRGRTA